METVGCRILLAASAQDKPREVICGMSKDADFDINTNKPFHLSLLGFIAFGLWASSGASFFASIPLFAWVMSRWIVEAFAVVSRRAEEDALEDWNGRHFCYDDIQVRIFWDDEQTWIRAADVFEVLGESPDAVSREKIAAGLGPAGYRTPTAVSGECFSGEGVLIYLHRFGDLRAARFRRWLEREVLPVLSRQRQCRTSAFEQHKIQ